MADAASGALPFLVPDAGFLPAAEALAFRHGWSAPQVFSDRKRDLAALVGRHAAILLLDADGLALQPLDKPLPGPVRVDFVHGEMRWRTGQGASGEMVAKACGVRKGATPRIFDGTAGLGRDAWILASLGCAVQLCERSPVIAALLQDGLGRAGREPALAATVARMQLQHSDTLAALTALAALPPEQRPEVVYLDPMFPHRDKSALVKKDMRVFRSVVGEDLDADALLAPARAVATKRVVVKRPRLAPDLAGVEPQQRMTGQSNRFDLYAPVVKAAL